MADEGELVLYELRDTVAIITLNRPEKRNALSRAVWRQLDAAFQRAEDDASVRAIVLSGNGKGFCAGADIAGGEDPTEPLPWLEFHQKHHRRQFSMWSSNKIIVAAIHGFAVGRGLEIALWCDMVVASEEARIGQPEVREGWVLWSVVPWLVGAQKAKYFMMSGDMIPAREAEALGLVTKVVPTGTARDEAIKLAVKLAHVPPVAARAVKHMVNAVYETMGIRAQQATGASFSALAATMSPEERGTAELERIRHEKGFKESVRFRDAPFES
jgi:enoyl-CoA hydratase/carnithine racemase